MSTPLLLGLKDDSLRKYFFESKHLLKGLQLCKKVRAVLLEGLSLSNSDLAYLIVKDVENLKGQLQR